MKTTIHCLGCMAEYESWQGICPYCGYEPGTPTGSALHMQPGSVLAGRYLLGRAIGSGGFGVTYIGWDNILQQKVAIKEYLPSEFATRALGRSQVTVFGGNKAEQFTSGLRKFLDEARRLAQFQDEPGIVRVFDSFEANNTAYIVMEYLDGETLTTYLEREGPIPADQAVQMLAPVIQSLETVHRAGVIHRDIAPDNIMLTKTGQVKLIDFGAARYATTSHSRSLTVIIKPGYSPEEQYRSRGDQGPHTDVYALGAVLYRMVTGQTPPDALERRTQLANKKKDLLVPPSKYCQLTRSQENAILNAMNVRIEDRTATAEKLLSEVTSPTPVQRVVGRIKAIDPMKWPLWVKIGFPVAVGAAACLLALLLTGRIGHFVNDLTTTITLGENMTRVPSVVNQTAEAAEERLTAQYLSAIVMGREESDEIPADMVLSQSVDAGDVVERGTQIELYISAAAQPVPENGVMPSVVYYTEAEALSMLDALELDVTVDYDHYDNVAEGLVAQQSVPKDTVVSPGDPVTLTVSLGKREPEEPGQVSEPPTSSPTVSTEYQPSLNTNSLSLEVGKTATLQVKGVPSTASVTWASSPYLGVIELTASGLTATVSAQSEGSTTLAIQVEIDGKRYSLSCAITVTAPEEVLGQAQITLSQTVIDPFYVGEAVVLEAYTTPADLPVTWSVRESSVATVDENGKVKAAGVGTTEVYASVTYGGKTYRASCTVIVSELDIILE